MHAGRCAPLSLGIKPISGTTKSDNRDEGKKDGVVLTELGYIKSGVDDIKRKQEKQDDSIREVVERLSSVESSAKQAHHRIDGLESRMSEK